MATATVHEPEIQEVAPSLPLITSGNFDTQVATAKRFPRSVARFMQYAQEMAILDPIVAASCIYAIPRDGKMIEGPSARLAEIVAHAWGNLRIQASAGSDEDGRFIVGRGEAWDVETNVAIAYEVRRRITGKNNRTFSDDMIAVTGNAAASIALRNAVFKAVPSAFWKPIYGKCREVVAGKAETFHTRRAEMLKAFGVMGVTKDQIIALLQVRGELDITLEHMVTLTGVFNSLKDGEAQIEDVFAPAAPIKAAERKSEQKTTSAPESSQAPEPLKTEPSTLTESTGKPGTVGEKATSGNALNVGTIAAIHEHGESIVVELNTGLKCSTKNPDIKTAARNLKDSQRIVELVTTAHAQPEKYMARLDEIIPVAAE